MPPFLFSWIEQGVLAIWFQGFLALRFQRFADTAHPRAFASFGPRRRCHCGEFSSVTGGGPRRPGRMARRGGRHCARRCGVPSPRIISFQARRGRFRDGQAEILAACGLVAPCFLSPRFYFRNFSAGTREARREAPAAEGEEQARREFPANCNQAGRSTREDQSFLVSDAIDSTLSAGNVELGRYRMPCARSTQVLNTLLAGGVFFFPPFSCGGGVAHEVAAGTLRCWRFIFLRMNGDLRCLRGAGNVPIKEYLLPILERALALNSITADTGSQCPRCSG